MNNASCRTLEGISWEIYKDAHDEWRWAKLAKNGVIISLSNASYKIKEVCIADARNHGMDGAVI